ncbi:DUF4272 domain-containing protein [uncultured Pseudoalteromonas sp.]|uniref:DUF4272 domain-containing protein n=1 Tax=uncultured Pseudoalteromonas sp. TaxID=114053 RepID=UPI0025927414|nr:DUF4272 domain-containing protein [uncultured Pseudoalteromonas sp.]
MFCTNCDKESDSLSLKDPVCDCCGFDNSYVLQLIEENDDELETEDEIRSSVECAQRSVILFGLVSAGNGEDRDAIVAWLKKEALWEYVTEEEKAFFESQQLTKRSVINATWRIESLAVLLWALYKLPAFNNFSELCDLDAIKNACDFYLKESKNFIENAELRSDDEIFDANELIYDSHWKVRDATINHQPIPEEIDSSIVQERHHAINWLIGYCGQEWDEITTDT